jgi:GH15 family glucan-1,4-alpha-glucosidase
MPAPGLSNGRWSQRCTYRGEYQDEVLTSLIVLKALTDQVTGAIVAAPTTSLPEDLGGERNWDYRYTWLSDSVLTLNALLAGGYTDEALAFSDAVFRATAGQPDQAQIMYGIAGERRLEEYKLDWLPGYEGSRPVRVGNAAAGQFQLDVYGEVVGVGWAVAMAVGHISEQIWRQLCEPVGLPGGRVAGTRRRHVGGPRSAAALYPVEGDGLARFRSRHRAEQSLRAGGPAAALGAGPGPDSR